MKIINFDLFALDYEIDDYRTRELHKQPIILMNKDTFNMIVDSQYVHFEKIDNNKFVQYKGVDIVFYNKLSLGEVEVR